MTGKAETNNLQILECTLRDGSYAVDFRFTQKDTGWLCGILSSLGFEYIEMGHGLGINASLSGKGAMDSTDCELLLAAKKTSGKAKIGMFCIPGIAKLEHLKPLADCGLNFVRIGYEADKIEETFDFVEEARKCKLETMVNFMKSYGISPQEFGKKAKGCVGAGAQVIYLVDSAGGMIPEEVARYVEEIKSCVDVPIGIHTHNNLHLATANALQAAKYGATFIDSTLYGLGRSAGNAPTEVVVALLENMNIRTGIDLFRLMDAAEQSFAPLMSKRQLHDMLSVAMGAGKFHSGFWNKVKQAAEKYHVDVRELIVVMGKKDPLRINDKELDEAARSLQKSGQGIVEKSHDMLQFDSASIRKGKISNTFESMNDLLEELVNASAKGAKKVVIEIVPSKDEDENLFLADYVMSDKEIVMGKVYFGSRSILESVLDLIKDRTTLLVLSKQSDDAWIQEGEVMEIVGRYMNRDNVMPANNFAEIRKDYLVEAIRLASHHLGGESLLVYGSSQDTPYLIRNCLGKFDNVYWYKSSTRLPEGLGNTVVLDDLQDWQDINLKFSLILCVSNPPVEDARTLKRVLKPDGKIITLGAVDTLVREGDEESVLSLDMNNAYAGAIHRWLHLKDTLIEQNQYGLQNVSGK